MGGERGSGSSCGFPLPATVLYESIRYLWKEAASSSGGSGASSTDHGRNEGGLKRYFTFQRKKREKNSSEREKKRKRSRLLISKGGKPLPHFDAQRRCDVLKKEVSPYPSIRKKERNTN